MHEPPAASTSATRARRITLVHNPESGDTSPTRDQLVRMLSEAGYVVRYLSAGAEGLAVGEHPGELVVVVGGDGTVGPVIAALADTGQPIGVLPTGTANNIADSLGIKGDARSVVDGWSLQSVVPFDVWRVTDGDVSGHLVETFGGGFFASCVRDSFKPSQPLVLGGPIDRALHLLRERVVDEPVRRWGVLLDGTDHSGRYIGVEVMNGRYLGPNIPLAPGATSSDGRLDVVLVTVADRDALAARLGTVPTAQTARLGSLSTIRAREVHLVPPSEVSLHLDGEPWESHSADGEAIQVRHHGTATLLQSRSPG